MKIDNYLKIGNNIRRIREQKNISQKEFAKKIKIPRSTYCNYENNNRSPDIDMLVKIADCLEVELNTIIFGEEELKAEIFIENIEANITNYGTDKGNYQLVDGYTVNYEVTNGYDSLNGSITIQEKDIEIESLKEKISEKVREILK